MGGEARAESAAAALVAAAGGPSRLRAVLTAFYDRVFADRMIGFFFQGRDKARLVEKELELVLQALGRPVAYTGQPLAEAHHRHPIQGGHFDRRLQILQETLADFGMDPAVQEAWLEHSLSLRSQITPDDPGACGTAGESGAGPPE